MFRLFKYIEMAELPVHMGSSFCATFIYDNRKFARQVVLSIVLYKTEDKNGEIIWEKESQWMFHPDKDIPS
jgi:hypothetical protein